MKKIKKKRMDSGNRRPAFVIGYSQTDPPPPGFLAAWFDQEYGGPLHVHFMHREGHSDFEAIHTSWRAGISPGSRHKDLEDWRDRLPWEHTRLIDVFPIPSLGKENQNRVLHLARIARGLTLLTEGTAYDVAGDRFLNPSDWIDRRLDRFHINDHVTVEQREDPESQQVWVYTLGLSKFGLEELEAYRPLGLPVQPVIDGLLEMSDILTTRGKTVKVGEHLILPDTDQPVAVTRHRTDHSTGRVLQLRRVEWISRGTSSPATGL